MRFLTLLSSTITVICISFSVVGLTIQYATKVHLPKSAVPPYCLMYERENEIFITIDKQQIVRVKFGDGNTVNHSFQYKPSEQNAVSTEVSLWQQKHKRSDVVVLADKSLPFPVIRDILYSLKITKIHKARFIVRF